MRRPQGFAITADPGSDRPLREEDTITCGHCQALVFIKPGTGATVYRIFDEEAWTWREEPGAFCRICMRAVCLQCHAYGGCLPWEKMLDRMEAKDRFVRSVLGG